jgi:hypothetical protein
MASRSVSMPFRWAWSWMVREGRAVHVAQQFLGSAGDSTLLAWISHVRTKQSRCFARHTPEVGGVYPPPTKPTAFELAYRPV